MQCRGEGMCAVDDVLYLSHLCGRSMSEQQELICLERCFVFHNAVFWNPYAVKSGSQNTQTSHNHRAFQCSYNPCNQWSGHQDWADTRNCEKGRADQKSPKAAPECAVLAPILHAIASIVVADDLLICVVAFADDR